LKPHYIDSIQNEFSDLNRNLVFLLANVCRRLLYCSVSELFEIVAVEFLKEFSVCLLVDESLCKFAKLG
jgi:hypothetical protein